MGGQQGQLHRYRTGACPHIPVGLAVPNRQLSDSGGPDLLLGHGDVAPQENFVGQALGAGRTAAGVSLHKQNGEGSKGVSCQAGDRVRKNLLLGVGERLSHRGSQVAQPRLSEAFTQGAGSFRTAGEEKYRLAVSGKNFPHRVAVKAVSRHHRPLLPGPAQPGGKVLQAGDTRQHLEGNVLCLQKRNQRAGTGIKSGVPAVQHAGVLPGLLLQNFHNLRRFGGKLSGYRLGQGALLQQTTGADQPVRLLQGGGRTRRQGGGIPKSNAHQRHFHPSSLLPITPGSARTKFLPTYSPFPRDGQ